MRAEVISIGDELTSGQRLDTNTQWLSLRLAELGVETAFHTTVADDLDANVMVFRNAIERADLVVATGGLGPTADDLTRQALARAVARELVLDADALSHIERLFARRARPMPERNQVQAYFPAGSRIIPNPEGTAPGIDLEAPRADGRTCRVIALPGVPAEMKEMWSATVVPRVAAMLPEPRVIRHRRIKCFGVGESDLEQMLPDLIRRGRIPSVGITVHEATITLRITATGRDEVECRDAMQPTARTIYECLGELVFGEEDDELEHAVSRQLQRTDLTLAVADCGTGGLVSQWLAAIADSGTHYLGGVQLASEHSILRWLDASADLMLNDDDSHSGVTKRLAEACRERFGVDIGLAVGPTPDPSPKAIAENAQPEPPKICLAICDRGGTQVRAVPYAGHSAILKPRAAKQALNLVRLLLQTR